MTEPRGRLTVAALLSFNGGFVDTVGFLGLSGLFVAHVTGNFVTLGAALVLGSHGILNKVLALPEFIAVIALARLLGGVARKRGWPALRIMLTTRGCSARRLLRARREVRSLRRRRQAAGAADRLRRNCRHGFAERAAARASLEPAADDAHDRLDHAGHDRRGRSACRHRRRRCRGGTHAIVARGDERAAVRGGLRRRGPALTG